MNTQQPQPSLSSHNGQELDVKEVFATLQGEGPYAGRPAIFIRLAGCNLACPGCDTDYSNHEPRLVKVTRLFDRATELAAEAFNKNWDKLVVITGGEPFRQNLVEVINTFHRHGYTVQIETNGTIYREDTPWHQCTVVCSPKTRIHPEMYDKADAWKIVVRASDAKMKDGLSDQILGGLRSWDLDALVKTGAEVYLQPEDSKNIDTNTQNLVATLNLVMKTRGARLSLQLHKIVGLE